MAAVAISKVEPLSHVAAGKVVPAALALDNLLPVLNVSVPFWVIGAEPERLVIWTTPLVCTVREPPPEPIVKVPPFKFITPPDSTIAVAPACMVMLPVSVLVPATIRSAESTAPWALV